ncbi:hypothetical protein D3C71_2055060 [compost metagenome]
MAKWVHHPAQTGQAQGDSLQRAHRLQAVSTQPRAITGIGKVGPGFPVKIMIAQRQYGIGLRINGFLTVFR